MPVRDLQEAIGQYEMYRAVLAEIEPERELYLAVPQRAYEGLFTDRFGQLIVDRVKMRVVVFDHQQRSFVKWID